LERLPHRQEAEEAEEEEEDLIPESILHPITIWWGKILMPGLAYRVRIRIPIFLV